MQHPARQKTALILLFDAPTVQMTQRIIEDLGHRCIVASNQSEAVEFLKKQPTDLLVCRIQEKTEDFGLLDTARQLRPECRSVAIIDASLEDYFPELATRAYPYNLVADNRPLDVQELAATIDKLFSSDIFGIEKYGVSAQENLRLTRTDQKYDLIETVSGFFLAQAIQERVVRNVELILNELLMNAVFDAPLGRPAEPPPSSLDRGAPLVLRPEEQPEVRYGISNERLAVSVSDAFGTFKKETFFLYVHRCFSEKSPLEDSGKGAGMGLFLVFKSLNQLVVNVAFHQKTEVVALIDRGISMRELKKQRHSFNYFHVGNH